MDKNNWEDFKTKRGLFEAHDPNTNRHIVFWVNEGNDPKDILKQVHKMNPDNVEIKPFGFKI